MPRKYSHIQEHEKEIIELRSQGMTLRQIGEKLGFTYKEMRGFLSRYNRKQRKLAACFPRKPPVDLQRKPLEQCHAVWDKVPGT